MAWLLIIAALGFLAYTLKPEAAVLARSFRAISWWNVLAATFIAIPMYVLKGCYHVDLLARLSGTKAPLRPSLAIYMQAQIVRYLPGKVWGLIYQSQRMTTTHRPGEIVVANLWQMVTTNLLALGVVASVMLAVLISSAWLTLLLPVVLSIELLHRYPAIEWQMLRRLGRFFPRWVSEVAVPSSPVPWSGTAILCAEWLFFFLAFTVFVPGDTGVTGAVLLAAWYGGASLLALAVFVVPAGLAVREAIFVAAPGFAGVEAASLVLVAAIARIVFFGAELVSALLFTLSVVGGSRGR